MLNYLKIHAKNNPQQETAKKSDHRLETETASDELKTGYSANTAPILLDVRTPAEFSDGHLAGAINIDFFDPNFGEIINSLPRNQSYILYCRSGGRAQSALETMRTLGFENITNAGGYKDASRNLRIKMVN
ncbi:rhodanese-like domain-containing protein [Arcanobacterium hippocoleae]